MRHYNFPQWLVEDANSMCVGVNDHYFDFADIDTRLLYTIATKIHHVESWGSFAKNEEQQGDLEEEKDDESWGSFAKNEEQQGGLEEEKDDEAGYRHKPIQWGKNASSGHVIT